MQRDRALDRLNAAPNDVVFGTGDKKWWKAALKDAKIKAFRWHDLQHTFCSRLAQAGVSGAASHKTIQMSAPLCLHGPHYLAESDVGSEPKRGGIKRATP